MSTFRIVPQGAGYSAQNYTNSPLGDKTPILLLGQGPELVPKFGDDRRPIAGTVDKVRIEIYYPQLGTMNLSLPVNFKMPKIDDLTTISLIEPEVFINRSGQIYVRAQNIVQA